ncbi:multiubiquitin domain-containing protein [Brevundimonas sp. 2R-24]|uniref:Multiubiquitin domain-containing protein n=1 Tax=Peiella sedimenti TaxID=3061083 RepID=A0ABT8SNH3_9CAUL|nr:multiubiquitin domain-containing protein [Caulobacteraceae bacterium XZ-24]
MAAKRRIDHAGLGIMGAAAEFETAAAWHTDTRPLRPKKSHRVHTLNAVPALAQILSKGENDIRMVSRAEGLLSLRDNTMSKPEQDNGRGSDKEVTIFVGEDEHIVPKAKISYDAIVALYLKDGGHASAEYLVKYSHGHSSDSSGTLAPGKDVMVHDGMRFRVSGTGES